LLSLRSFIHFTLTGLSAFASIVAAGELNDDELLGEP
jgi:hypothetical protein